MAPKKANWDVNRDNMLFMLLVEHINCNWNDIAKKWTEKYPDDESAPSGSAISQHIAKLKKGSGPNSGLGTASKNVTPMKTPTAKRAAPPKTQSSSAKRARTSRSRMSDEDDSDDEKNMTFDNTAGKRETPRRRSSGPRKSYREGSDEEEEDTKEALDGIATGGATAVPAQASTTAYSPAATPRDSVQADDIDDLFGGPRKVTARSKSNPQFDQIRAEESDEDTFAPMV